MFYHPTLIKKEIKISPNIRKFRMEQLQSHIWLSASLYMGKNWFSFLSVHCHKQFLPFYSNFSLDYYILYLTLIHLPPLRFYYVGEDAGIEPRTFRLWQLAVRHSKHSARSHPYSARSHLHSARSHPRSARSHPNSARSHHIRLDLIYSVLSACLLKTFRVHCAKMLKLILFIPPPFTVLMLHFSV